MPAYLSTDPFAGVYEDAEQMAGLRPGLLSAIAEQENVNPRHNNPLGLSTDSGVMSFTPEEGEARIYRQAKLLTDQSGPYADFARTGDIGALAMVWAPPGAANDIHGTNSTEASGIQAALDRRYISTDPRAGVEEGAPIGGKYLSTDPNAGDADNADKSAEDVARALEGTAQAKQALGLLLQPLGEDWRTPEQVTQDEALQGTLQAQRALAVLTQPLRENWEQKPAEAPNLTPLRQGKVRFASEMPFVSGSESIKPPYKNEFHEPGDKSGAAVASGLSDNPIARNAMLAAANVLRGFVPTSPKQVLGLLTPLVGAVEEVKNFYSMVRDVVGGASIPDAFKANSPGIIGLSEADKTPPFSRERFEAGFGMLAQFGMLAVGGRGLVKTAAPKLSPRDAIREKLGGKPTSTAALEPPVQPESPQPSSAISSTEAIRQELGGQAGLQTRRALDASDSLQYPVSSGTNASIIADNSAKPAGAPSDPSSFESAANDVARRTSQTAPGVSTQADALLEAIYRGSKGTGVETPVGFGGRGSGPPSQRGLERSEAPRDSTAQDNSGQLTGTANAVPPSSLTSTKNAVTDAEREAQVTSGVANRVLEGQIGNITSGEGMSWQEMVDLGRQKINEGADPQAIANRFKRNKQISPTDFAVLRAERERLALETNRAEEAQRQTPNNPQVKALYDAARKTEVDWIRNVVQPAKTATSDIFRGMQGEAPIDTNTFAGLRRAVADLHKRDISPEEGVRLARAAAKVQKATGAASDALRAASEIVETRIRPPKSQPRSMEQLRDHLSQRIKTVTPC